MSSPQLAITHIAAAQNQKEVTANAAVDALDNSDNALISIANADADQTLSQAQLASAGCIKITGAITADRHVNLPAVSRSFIFQNATTGGHNLVVQVTGAPGAVATIGAAAGLVEIFSDGTNVVTLTGGSGSAGTVTSVALTVPAEFSVSGSPVTGAGTLAVSKVSQSQNLFFASPNGSSGVMAPRAIVAADLPGGVAVPNFADAETPSGTIDGSNAAFTLAHSPSPAGSLQLFKNGRVMFPAGVDYTLSGGTITYTSGSKPQTGDVHIAWYRY
jgi:hypothetical protein